jgi:hypothetical protein
MSWYVNDCWSTMHISVRYTLGLRQTVRLLLYLRRKVLWTYVVVGVLLIVLGVVVPGHTSPLLVTLLIVIGALVIIEYPVLIWMAVYRNRWIILKGAEVTLTSEGIERHTDTTTVHVTWDMVERIHELDDVWIFRVNRLTHIAVGKEALTPEQRQELAAFITGRTK